MRNLEYMHQVKVANYIDSTYPQALWTASSSGMRTNVITGKRMKMAGGKRGVPDILFFEPKGRLHGLFIELKIPENKNLRQRKGIVSAEQKEFLRKADERGYCAFVAYGADEACKIIDDYVAERIK